jgi:hypothetical protein
MVGWFAGGYSIMLLRRRKFCWAQMSHANLERSGTLSGEGSIAWVYN